MDCILQWNIKSIRHKKSELIFLINKFNPFLIAISETWLKPESRFHIRDFVCLRHDRPDGWDGVALMIKKHFPYSLIPLPVYDGIYAVAIKSTKFSVMSIYIPHPSVTVINHLKLLIRLLPGPVIIVGDFNCHHTLWDQSTNSYGILLSDVIDEFNLCVLNDGSPTRRVSPSQNPSAVDLSICSPSLSSSLIWNVSTTTYGSDHAPITISFPCSAQASTQVFNPSQKYSLKAANWDSFSQSTEEKTQILPCVSADNLDSCYTAFTDVLHAAASESIPLKRPNNKVPPTPWWDSDCALAVKDRKTAEKTYVKAMTLENYLNYKKVDAKCKRLLSSKKRDGWIKFCQSISPSTRSSMVWKNIRRFKSAFNVASPPSTNTKSWTEAFLDKLAPPYVPSYSELPLSLSQWQSLSSDNLLTGPFSVSELEAVLVNLSDSAPGLDGFAYSFIVKASKGAQSYFLSLINFYFLQGYCPDSWKEQIVLPLLKPDKDASCASSYRPIALSSVLCKIMEHLLKIRLDWFVESNGILPDCQHGFRKGRSCSDSHSILYTDIRIAFSRQEHVVSAFLDIKAAYDSVIISVLRSKLLRLNIPDRLVHFICNMLSPRKINLKIDGKIVSNRVIHRGLPQGSVLSPILFNLYTCDLLSSVQAPCQVLQYADDICMYISCKDIHYGSTCLNQSLKYLGDWLSNHGLELSPSKSVAVLFTRSRIVPSFSISFNNCHFPVRDKVRFLGLIMDSNLTGKYHVEHIIKKCERYLNLLRCLSGVWWGAHPYSQKLLYNAFIRSNLDFGTFVLEPCNKFAMRRLESVQSKALRVVTGAMKSSPVKALQVECSDPPLGLRRCYLSDRYIFRISQLSSHPLIPKLRCLLNLTRSSSYWTHKELPNLIKSFIRIKEINAPLYELDKLPIYKAPYQSLSFVPEVFTNIGIDKESVEANSKFLNIVGSRWPDWHLFFTDASKFEDSHVGCAFIDFHSKYLLTHKLPPEATVYTGEGVAILSALIHIANNCIQNSIIFSDNKSFLEAISLNPIKNSARNGLVCKVKEILFYCLESNIHVVLAWVPSHVGIRGNELADSLAKEAVVSGDEMFYQNFSQDLLTLPHKNLISEWFLEWSTYKYIYSNVQPTIPSRPWFYKSRNFSKPVTSTLIRLRLGHICSPVRLFKYKIRDSPLCDCGEEDGSEDHIFFRCNINNKCPSLYDLLISSNEYHFPVNMRYLLTFPFSSTVHILGYFIKSNDIRI